MFIRKTDKVFNNRIFQQNAMMVISRNQGKKAVTRHRRSK